jgi:hypothetical protein
MMFGEEKWGFPDFFKELYRNFVSSVTSVSSPSCFMVDPYCHVRNSEAGTKPSHPASAAFRAGSSLRRYPIESRRFGVLVHLHFK